MQKVLKQNYMKTLFHTVLKQKVLKQNYPKSRFSLYEITISYNFHKCF